jgi:hypothetical protein
MDVLTFYTLHECSQVQPLSAAPIVQDELKESTGKQKIPVTIVTGKDG